MLGLHDSEKLISNEKKFTDYDDDLYKFYHLEESQIRVNSKGFKVDFQMRKNVVDWLIQTHYEQKLMPETLYLCVNILMFFRKSSLKSRQWINLNSSVSPHCCWFPSMNKEVRFGLVNFPPCFVQIL